MTIGVLALQGDFEAHLQLLRDVPEVSRVLEVRDAATLSQCDGLIIPGGESTVMSRLCDRYGLWEPLSTRLQAGMGVLGTCAGLIMLSQNIEGATRNFTQKTLGAIDVDVARNAYGAQIDSFEADVALEDIKSEVQEIAPPELVHAVFIRAPRITRCGPTVEVLARHDGEPVAVRQGNRVATTFHPEIAGEARLHQMWLRSLQNSQTLNNASNAEMHAANVQSGDVPGLDIGETAGERLMRRETL